MKRVSIAAILLFGLCFKAQAVNLNDWIKKSGGYQKPRKVKSGQTSVAAIRGVEEPGEVDEQARDFEALKKVEGRNVSKEKLEQFIKTGMLNKK